MLKSNIGKLLVAYQYNGASIPNVPSHSIATHSIPVANRIARCGVHTVRFTPLNPKRKVGGGRDEGENPAAGLHRCDRAREDTLLHKGQAVKQGERWWVVVSVVRR